MSGGYTRRTHVVRVYGQNSDKSKDKTKYMDIEVLDAIAYRTDNGKEHVLNCPAEKAQPYIVDDTQSGLEKSPSATSATRRTHVKQVKGGANAASGAQLLVEVLDAAAFRDENGKEWILDFTSDPDAFDTTDNTGSTSSTRRVHDEKIDSATPPKPNPTSAYATVQRTDMVAFRSVRGEELIMKMPSADDGSSDRANTYITSPQGYDPTDDTMDVPDNNDPHFYIQFDKDGASPLIGDAKIDQGPLWWIRKIKVGGPWLFIFGSASGNGIGDLTPLPVDCSVTWQIDGFPGPNYLVQNGLHASGQFFQAPHTVTKTDLIPFPGQPIFMTGVKGPQPRPFGEVASGVWISCTGPLAKPFNITMTGSQSQGDSTFYFGAAALYKQTDIKVGTQLDFPYQFGKPIDEFSLEAFQPQFPNPTVTTPPATGPSSAVAFYGEDAPQGNRTSILHVDPSKMTVTARAQ